MTKHVTERASAGLRAVCSQACVSLGALEEAAAEVGMDKGEVHSALVFLHDTGSVLHYGQDTHCSSHALQGTIFMQPQCIRVIDTSVSESLTPFVSPAPLTSMRRSAHWTRTSDSTLTMAWRWIGSSARKRHPARAC